MNRTLIYVLAIILLIGSAVIDVYSYRKMRADVEDVQKYFKTVHELVLQNQQYNAAILKRNEDTKAYNEALDPGEKHKMEEVVQP